jgi:DNA repair protein RecO (recombination protein O)
MAIDNATAIIVRAIDFSETSKIVTMFSREFGKIKAIAKGGRRLKAQFEVALDVLSVCGIAVLRKPMAELDLLTEATLLERFDGLKQELHALHAAYFVAEVLDGLTQPNDPHPRVYDATLEALRDLSRNKDRARTVFCWIFEVLGELGYAPKLEQCADCDAAIDRQRSVVFDVQLGGVLCGECARRHASTRSISQGTLQAMRLLARPDDPRTSRLALNNAAMDGISNILTSTIQGLLGRPLRTVGLLRW